VFIVKKIVFSLRVLWQEWFSWTNLISLILVLMNILLSSLFIETAVFFPMIFACQKLLLVFWRLRNFIRAFISIFIKDIVYLSLVFLYVVVGGGWFWVGVHLVSQFVYRVAVQNVLVAPLVQQSFFLVWIVITCVFRIFTSLIHCFVIFRKWICLRIVILDWVIISVTANFMYILKLNIFVRNFILFECLMFTFILIIFILVFNCIGIDKILRSR
jgi:hypothetical protein